MRMTLGFALLHSAALRVVAGTILVGVALMSCPLAQAQTVAVTSEKRKLPEKKTPPKKATALPADKTTLQSFATSPFPFDGTDPKTGKPFLDVTEGERRGHRGMRGQVYWADETYDDSSVLLHLPKGFDPQKPGVIVVFFHGHGAKLDRDVIRRQQVAAQISRSGLNAALVAPQFALDAADSSAGKFWQAGTFLWFMEEAAQQLAHLYGDKHAARAFARMPLVFVAYSGGYLPAAYAVHNGGVARRLNAVLLLDALYGDIDKYTRWIQNFRSGVFVSAYTHHTADNNAGLQKTLKERNILFDTELRKPLKPGSIAFLSTGEEIKHRDYVTEAWSDQPIRDFLQALQVPRR